ncbi:MAG: hypothetical protein ACLRRT_01995 [Ruthenibacterium lactatiformans]
MPEILRAYESQRRKTIIVIEGAEARRNRPAGHGDIVNMGLAELVNAPVLLWGHRQGRRVRAALRHGGSLQPEERARVSARSSTNSAATWSCFARALRAGGKDGRARAGRRALYPRGHRRRGPCAVPCAAAAASVDIAWCASRISICSFSPLESHPRWACGMERAGQLGEPDLVVLPGTKTRWETLPDAPERPEAAVKKLAAAGTPCWACGATRCWERRWTTRTAWSRGHMDGRPLPCTTRFTGRRCTVCRRVPPQAVCGRSWTTTDICDRTRRHAAVLLRGRHARRGGRQCVRHLSARPV